MPPINTVTFEVDTNFKHDKSRSLIENGQTIQIRFAVSQYKEDGKVEQISRFFRCKDYFTDVIYTKVTGKGFIVYGFDSCKHLSEATFNNNFTDFLVEIPNNIIENVRKNISNGLNKYEKSINIMETIIVPTNRKHIYYVMGDTQWKDTTHSMSLYTLLFRVCGYSSDMDFSNRQSILNSISKDKSRHDPPNYKPSTDFSLLNFIEDKKFDSLLYNPFGDKKPINKNMIEREEHAEEYDDYDGIHSYGGLVSYLSYGK